MDYPTHPEVHPYERPSHERGDARTQESTPSSAQTPPPLPATYPPPTPDPMTQTPPPVAPHATYPQPTPTAPPPTPPPNPATYPPQTPDPMTQTPPPNPAMQPPTPMQTPPPGPTNYPLQPATHLATPSAIQQSPIVHERQFQTGADLTEEMTSVRWYWHDWIAQGKLNMIVAQPNVGKSWLATRLAASVIDGRANIDGTAYIGRKGNVLLVDFEQDSGSYVERLRMLGVDPEHLLFPFYRGEYDTLRGLDDSVTQNRIKEVLQRGNIAMVIIDSLSGGTSGKDENSSAMLGPTQFLAKLAEQYDVAFVLIHHTGKRFVDNNGPGVHHARGHSSILQMARCAIMLDNPIGERPDIVRARVVKNNRSRTREELAYKIDDGKFKIVDLDEEREQAKKDAEPIKDRPFTPEEQNIYASLKRPGNENGLSIRKAAETFNVSISRIRSIKELGDRHRPPTQVNTPAQYTQVNTPAQYTQVNTPAQGHEPGSSSHQSFTHENSGSPGVYLSTGTS